jgi:hypothetical protein
MKKLLLLALAFACAACNTPNKVRMVVSTIQPDKEIASLYNRGIQISEVKGKNAEFRIFAIPLSPSVIMVSLSVKSKGSFIFEPATDAWLYAKEINSKGPYKSLKLLSEDEVNSYFTLNRSIWVTTSSGLNAIAYYKDSSDAENAVTSMLKKHSLTEGEILSGNLFFALNDADGAYTKWEKNKFVFRVILGGEESKININAQLIPNQKYPEYLPDEK